MSTAHVHRPDWLAAALSAHAVSTDVLPLGVVDSVCQYATLLRHREELDVPGVEVPVLTEAMELPAALTPAVAARPLPRPTRMRFDDSSLENSTDTWTSDDDPDK